MNESAEKHVNHVNIDETSDVPAVSIIVPVYKVPEQYLRKCAESCIAQTLRNIEILLVDDGSPVSVMNMRQRTAESA